VIKLNSKYLEYRLRKTLGVSSAYFLKTEDLKHVNGIYIGDAEDIDSCAIPIYWQLDSTAFKMTVPNFRLNYSELNMAEGWEEELKLFSHIRSFYCTQHVSSSVLNWYTNLNDLELSGANILDWSFLAKMMKLRNVILYECGSEGNQALKYLCDLYSAQIALRNCLGTENKIDPKNLLLENIAIIGMSVSSITPLMNVKRLTELNLSFNAIKDISSLSKISAHCVVLN